MMLTLTLAAGLLGAPEPQKGWVVELRGYTYHRKQAETPRAWIIEWQFPQAKLRPEPVEAHYYDDLSAFFRQLKMQRQGEAVEGVYVDDLPAFFKQLKKR